MPSPFPGMDPYLEGEFWGMFHADLATKVKRLLIPQLAPRYYPFTEKCFLVDDEEVAIEERMKPDIAVTQQSRKPMPSANVMVAGPIQMTIPRPKRRRVPHFRVAIRDLAKRTLVTVIEFLSPTNTRGRGRRQYLDKRNGFLLSAVNLVEVDLLREGARLPMVGKLPPASYYVFVCRANERPLTHVWPIRLQAPCPRSRYPCDGKTRKRR